MRLTATSSQRFGWVLLGLIQIAGCSGGGTSPIQGNNSPKRIIILSNASSPFWDACRTGLQDAEKTLELGKEGLVAVVEVNDGTAEGQIEKLHQFASQTDIAALGISACDADNVAIADLLRQLKEKGVKVITLDSDMDRTKLRDTRVAFVGTDNLQGGRELGKCARNLRPEGGDYITFVGRTGAQNAIERIIGFAQGAGDRFRSVDSMGDDTDSNKARENVRTALKDHPNLTTLVGIWSYNAPAIVDVVQEPNSPKKRSVLTIVTFDADPGAIKAMGENNIDAMVVQDPYQMGYQGVRLMKALVKEDQATINEMLPHLGQQDGDIVDTGLKVVVPDQGSPLQADMFDKKAKFLTLREFRLWLDKNHLTGS